MKPVDEALIRLSGRTPLRRLEDRGDAPQALVELLKAGIR